jgi:hypothetical protein
VPGKAAAATSRTAPAATAGAQVIDLASRRKIVMTGLRRVSTVAASVVLLASGVALGIQTIGNRSEPPSSPDSALKPPEVQATYLSNTVFNIPADAVPDSRGNYVVPKTGTIYVPNDKDKKVASKVIKPNGDEIVQGTSGKPILITPQTVTTSKGNQATTAVKPQGPNNHPAGSAPAGGSTPPAADPAVAPAAQPTAAPNTPAPATGPAQGPSSAVAAPDAAKSGSNPKITSHAERPTEGDPYVTESGSAYSDDNFAGKVMDLVTDAQQHSNPNDNGKPVAASSGSTVSDPAAPPDTTANDTTPDTTGKRFGGRQDVTAGYRAPSSTVKPNAHGPASFAVQARVLRCAALTHRQAIAGDSGLWGDKAATIVVVQSDSPDQVIGYVFYGECSHSGPVTTQESPWEQRVDKPGTQPATPPTSPSKRVGGVTSSQTQTQVNSSTPATTPPVGANSATPAEELS